ncbi:MAG: c-type cytochrome [Gemmatimonadaceae bacterium]
MKADTMMLTAGRSFIRATTVLLSVACFGCESGAANQPAHGVPGGDPERGRALISQYGCGSCHNIPGVRDAHSMVGPPLDHFDRRTYIAGVLPNQLESLTAWIMDPQKIIPGNAMPNMRVSARDARNIAAYLYTLR